MHATGCTDDRQKCMLRDAQTTAKRMLSLHTAGACTLADTGVTYDEAVAALNAHFQPQVDVTF